MEVNEDTMDFSPLGQIHSYTQSTEKHAYPIFIINNLDNTAVFLFHWRRGDRPLWLWRLSSFFFKLLLRDERKKISHPNHVTLTSN